MKTIAVALMTSALFATGVAYAQSGADLAKAKNCTNCHEMDKKKVGPAFKDVAAKYKDNKDAEATLATKLKEGKGHPTKVAASEAELKALVQYSLTGK